MIQYFHKRNSDIIIDELLDITLEYRISPKGGLTVAMEEVPAWFFDTLQVGHFFEKKVGIARCSDEDNYCRKTGRDLAASRMKPTRLTVIRIVGDLIVLEDKDEALYFLKKNRNKVHFVEYDNE